MTYLRTHPTAALVLRRSGVGLLTLAAVSLIVFAATQVLPGNAAVSILGRTATPERLQALELQLHLQDSIVSQYWSWLSGILSGDPGISFASNEPVWEFVSRRLVNSAVLVACAGLLGAVIGIALGALAALKRDGIFDYTLAVGSLTVTALPEFLVGIGLVMLLATTVFNLLPAVSLIAPGETVLSDPQTLILPVLTLTLAVAPYIARMTRAALIEALESEYVKMAELKGLSRRRVLLVHALPNAIAPAIQVIGLCLLYLAGGIVVVEYLFAFPGIGQGLVSAVNSRDVPVIQFIVIALAAFYIAVNILTDVLTLLVSPRRRLAR